MQMLASFGALHVDISGGAFDPDDLYQLGCMGFIKAIQGFDLSYGTQFSTYAVPKISGEIRRFLRDDGSVKVSRGIKESAYNVRNARNTLEQQLGREPTLSELSAETGITIEDIAVCRNSNRYAGVSSTGGRRWFHTGTCIGRLVSGRKVN